MHQCETPRHMRKSGSMQQNWTAIVKCYGYRITVLDARPQGWHPDEHYNARITQYILPRWASEYGIHEQDSRVAVQYGPFRTSKHQASHRFQESASSRMLMTVHRSMINSSRSKESMGRVSLTGANRSI